MHKGGTGRIGVPTSYSEITVVGIDRNEKCRHSPEREFTSSRDRK